MWFIDIAFDLLIKHLDLAIKTFPDNNKFKNQLFQAKKNILKNNLIDVSKHISEKLFEQYLASGTSFYILSFLQLWLEKNTASFSIRKR